MRILLNLWSMISFLAAIALLMWVNHSYGWRGLVALVVFLLFVHCVFRKRTGRWMDVDGN